MVTGGAGFIGSHIVGRLIQEGYHVAVVDDLSAGRREQLHPEATFYQMDVADPALKDVLVKERPWVVSHHAAQSTIPASLRDPVHDARVNVLGSVNLMEACRAAGVQRVVFASSGGAIYGNPDYLPCDESHPLRPLAPYGAAKAAVEGYLATYGRSFGLRYTVLRYGNVYGPRQNPQGEAGVIAIFALAMLQGRQPVIYGSGEQERDFVYISDAVEANVLAIQRSADGVYNIGSGEGTSVNRIFTHLKGILSYREEPRYEPVRLADVLKVRLDCSRARRELAWRPTVALEEGLKHTVEYLGLIDQTR
ncbi:MAG: NAD-dependent epimerase/dehydratase family protein [Chloroflexi bacterium]|nr:NAD-dependent epimerase/dehydratase family protein [Chloroflexota bacterium]